MERGPVVDLDFEAPRINGRAVADLTVEVMGPLTAEDLVLLEMEKGVKVTPLQRIHNSHHGLARCLALGMKPAQAALVSGFTLGRVYTLRLDPTFTELVEAYRNEKENFIEGFAEDFTEQMLGVSKDALELLRERLHESPEDVSTVQLIETIKTLSDRAGFGPKSTQVNVNVDLAGRLATARQRMKTVESSSLPQRPDSAVGDLVTPVSHEVLQFRAPGTKEEPEA